MERLSEKARRIVDQQKELQVFSVDFTPYQCALLYQAIRILDFLSPEDESKPEMALIIKDLKDFLILLGEKDFQCLEDTVTEVIDAFKEAKSSNQK